MCQELQPFYREIEGRGKRIPGQKPAGPLYTVAHKEKTFSKNKKGKDQYFKLFPNLHT